MTNHAALAAPSQNPPTEHAADAEAHSASVAATARIRPAAVTTIAVLIGLTITRFTVVFRLPSLEMFDGASPDAWFAPWVSDTILGLLVPAVVFLVLRRTGTALWGALIAYNAVGAFDYVHGLATQWIHPLENAAVTYGAISFFLVAQLIALGLLFRADVIDHFTRRPARTS